MASSRLRPCPELAKGKVPRLAKLPQYVVEGLRSGRGVTGEGGVGGGREKDPWKLEEEEEGRLRSLFEAMDENDDGLLEEEERTAMKQTLTRFLMERGMSTRTFEGLGGLVFEDFRTRFVAEWETTRKEQMLADVHMRRAAASCLRGGSPLNPLETLEDMTEQDIGRWCRGELADALIPLFRDEQKRLREQRERRKKHSDQGLDNNKFGVPAEMVRKAKFGDLKEFHKGLGSQLGLPHPRLWEGMEAEHCRRPGSKTGFTPGNYGSGMTTSHKEWEIATQAEEGTRVSGESNCGRRVLPTEELMQDETVRKAGLRDVEVVALKLYTGPMFCLYNAVLRQFPDDILKILDGNAFTTTIYCIVSGLIKLSRVTNLPENRTVYRGLGGLQLPEAFVEADEYGVRGGVEFAMMSTTLDRKVALQYAGSDLPTVFEIGLGAIDRGASLKCLSQYPEEDEILLPPRSYLEVEGTSRLEVGEHGVLIRVVKLKVNANVTSSTVEEMEGGRKYQFVSAAEHTVREIHSKLGAMLESQEVEDVLKHRLPDRAYKRHVQVSESIIKEAETWLRHYQGKEVAWYNDEYQFAHAARELTKLEIMSLEKFKYWMEVVAHDTASKKMEMVSREIESEMMRKLNHLKEVGEAGAAEARETALQLAKRRGAVISAVDEKNDLGETPMVAMSAKGDVGQLRLLLDAGCNIDSTSESRQTALHVACMMGDVEYAKALVQAGADVSKTDTTGATCMHFAARPGHVRVMEFLCEVGGKELITAVDNEGDTCVCTAAVNGHLPVLRLLFEKGGIDLFFIVNKRNWSCAFRAATNCHLESLSFLYDMCGKELLMIANADGLACGQHAALNGNLSMLEFVYEKCGGDHLLNTLSHGASIGVLGALSGSVDTMRFLINKLGRGILTARGRGGASVLMMALQHQKLSAYLVEEGGWELLSLVDQGGWSALHRILYVGFDAVATQIASGFGEQGLSLLDKARSTVQEGSHDHEGDFMIWRGWPRSARVVKAQGHRVEFGTEMCTLRSVACCPVGKRAYYEVEIVEMDFLSQMGFASAAFTAVKGYSEEVVGLRSSSLAVDGTRGEKLFKGVQPYDCQWKKGDVVGLACDLVEGTIHVSVNGDFSAPNGEVFDLGSEMTDLYALCSGATGTFVFNLGEAPFKFPPPKCRDGFSYPGIKQVREGGGEVE